jgi:hypothetical protein
MSNPGIEVEQSTAKPAPLVAAPPKLLAGVMFGLVFGFLLQKGGVGKFNVLIGQLLLQDFTVAKIMLTAILVGMIGVFTLHHFGKANFTSNPRGSGPTSSAGCCSAPASRCSAIAPARQPPRWDKEAGTRSSAWPVSLPDLICLPRCPAG